MIILFLCISILAFCIGIIGLVASSEEREIGAIFGSIVILILSFISYGHYQYLRICNNFEKKLNVGEVKIEEVDVKTYRVIP